METFELKQNEYAELSNGMKVTLSHIAGEEAVDNSGNLISQGTTVHLLLEKDKEEQVLLFYDKDSKTGTWKGVTFTLIHADGFSEFSAKFSYD